MFEVMYYPYASIENEQTLKRCLFYLDKIYVLTPDESTIAQNRSELSKIKRSLSGRDSIFKGASGDEIQKIIEPIHPLETLHKYEHEFVNSVKEDLRDDKFRELSGQGDYWMLYEKKFPRLVKMGFRDKIKEWKGEFFKVDRDLGESILINHVIYSCLNKKISPLTDEVEHSRILTHKINRNYDTYKSFLYEQGYIEDLKQQLLIKRVLEKRLYSLENVDIEDIVSYREDHKKELKRFTVEMGKISNQIKSKPFDLEFESEISQIVNDKINPSIEDLNMGMQEFKDEMVTRSIRSAIKIVPVALTFSILAFNVSWEVGALSALVGNTILSKTDISTGLSETLLDYWQQNKRYERNSLQYLIGAEKI